ncbi:MAG: RDD family protein [Actinomycetota bacterium]
MSESSTPDWDAPEVAIISDIAHEPKAGFWLRFVANLCDGIMVSIISIPFAIISASTTGTAAALSQSGQFVVSFFVLAYWIGTQGGSPLRRKLGVFILDQDDGSFIGQRRAVQRIMMSWVSGIVFLLGYLAMLRSPQSQTWHDRVAHSVVVKR